MGRLVQLKAVCKFYLCVLQTEPKMGIKMAMVHSCRRSDECGQLGGISDTRMYLAWPAGPNTPKQGKGTRRKAVVITRYFMNASNQVLRSVQSQGGAVQVALSSWHSCFP